MVAAARNTGAWCRSARSGAARRTCRSARDRAGRQARQDRAGRDVLLLPHARDRQPAGHRAAGYLDWEMWTGPAPMRPYNALVHPRGWRAFMEYGNGIIGDMCVHMLDMVRWMMGLGWPKRVSFDRRHPSRQSQQGEYLGHADRDLRLRRPARRLAAPHLGRPPTRNIRGARRSMATRER